MTFINELLRFGAYFLLLSTTLQSQDAFVFFQQSQYSQAQEEQTTRGGRLFIYLVFAVLCYLTLVVTPYLNISLRKMCLGACIIILAKYFCELSMFADTLQTFMELVAAVLDIIGESIFYLTGMRVVQVICEKHDSTEQTGRLFSVFAALYGLSIVLGYAISFGCYTKLPVWTFIIVLTCMTILSGILCFFTFPIDSNEVPANTLHEENSEPTAAQGQPRLNRHQAVDQIYRDGLSLGGIMKHTFVWYKKMLLVLPIQFTLGIFIGFIFNLLEYLIWVTQNDELITKLAHNVDTILIFEGGAILASIVTGILCDCISMKKVGTIALVISIIVFCSLYLGISSKNIEVTLFLYLLSGFCMFMLGCWLIIACSKIYAGKFQVFSVTMQFIGMSLSLYTLGVIMFQDRVDYELRLCLQLGLLIGSAIICILFLKKLPSGQIQVSFEESRLEQTQTSQRRDVSPQVQVNADLISPKVEIQMVNQGEINQKIEAEIEKKEDFPPLDPDALL